MGFFKKLFGKGDSRAVKLARKVLDQAEKDPYRVLGFTIIEAAIRCLERIKPFFLPGKAKTEAHLTEFYVFNEFLYFFLHMSHRGVFRRIQRARAQRIPRKAVSSSHCNGDRFICGRFAGGDQGENQRRIL
jgi:hypothetical protein